MRTTRRMAKTWDRRWGNVARYLRHTHKRKFGQGHEQRTVLPCADFHRSFIGSTALGGERCTELNPIRTKKEKKVENSDKHGMRYSAAVANAISTTLVNITRWFRKPHVPNLVQIGQNVSTKQKKCNLLISNFRRAVNVVLFHLGDSPPSELYVQ